MTRAASPSAAPGPAKVPWSARVRTSLWGPSLLALVVAGGGLGGFIAWGATAPLAGAVIAPGSIAAHGENQSIQHLEGGIIKALHVKEGDKVVAGQVLISLDPTIAEAGLNRMRKTFAGLRIEEARLVAEQRDLDEISFPSDLREQDVDASTWEVFETKTVEFQARRSLFRNEVRILEERLAGLEQEIAGTEAQRVATQKQLGFLRDELRDVESLFQKGLARADQLFSLKRSEAEMEGRDGSLLASIGKARQTIAEIRQQMEKIGHDRRTDAATRLSDTRNRIADMLEQIRSSESVLSRIVIRAPIAAIVVRTNVNTIGAVISPAQAVIELLPADAELVVEARLAPSDVDALHIGQAANVRLSALNQRVTPVVAARVTYVSADKLTDRTTQQVYYRVRLTIDPDQLGARERELIFPGMPVEALIMTAERTMFQYLFRPILDSIAHAFREE